MEDFKNLIIDLGNQLEDFEKSTFENYTSNYIAITSFLSESKEDVHEAILALESNNVDQGMVDYIQGIMYKIVETLNELKAKLPEVNQVVETAIEQPTTEAVVETVVEQPEQVIETVQEQVPEVEFKEKDINTLGENLSNVESNANVSDNIDVAGLEALLGTDTTAFESQVQTAPVAEIQPISEDAIRLM